MRLQRWLRPLPKFGPTPIPKAEQLTAAEMRTSRPWRMMLDGLRVILGSVPETPKRDPSETAETVKRPMSVPND